MGKNPEDNFPVRPTATGRIEFGPLDPQRQQAEREEALRTGKIRLMADPVPTKDQEIAALRADLRALAHAATDVVRHFPAGPPQGWEDRLVEALARPSVRAVMEGRE